MREDCKVRDCPLPLRLASFPVMPVRSLRLCPLAAILLASAASLKAQTAAGGESVPLLLQDRRSSLHLLAAPRLDRPWHTGIHPLLENLPVLPPGYDTTLLAPRTRTHSLDLQKGLPLILQAEPSVLENPDPAVWDWLRVDPKLETAEDRLRRQLQKEKDGFQVFGENDPSADPPQGKDDEGTGPVPKLQPSRASKTPGEIYLQGHHALKDGTDLENRSDFDGAYFKFKEARDLFDAAHQTDRGWQPDIVEYRRRKIREEMERVRQLEIQHRAGPGTASPAPSEQEGKSKDQPARPDPQRAQGSPKNPDEKVRQKPQSKKGKPDKPSPKHPRTAQGPRETGTELRRRLHEAEAALQQSRRREEALRTVVRDLIQQIDPPEGLLPAMRQPPLKPPFPPRPSSSPPPPVPPSLAP